MFVDTFVDTFLETCVDMFLHGYVDTFVDTFVEMCLDTFLDAFPKEGFASLQRCALAVSSRTSVR